MTERRQSDRDPPAVAQVEPTGGMLAPSVSVRRILTLEEVEAEARKVVFGIGSDFGEAVAKLWNHFVATDERAKLKRGETDGKQ
jgi:hypothetical protein